MKEDISREREKERGEWGDIMDSEKASMKEKKP